MKIIYKEESLEITDISLEGIREATHKVSIKDFSIPSHEKEFGLECNEEEWKNVKEIFKDLIEQQSTHGIILTDNSRIPPKPPEVVNYQFINIYVPQTGLIKAKEIK